MQSIVYRFVLQRVYASQQGIKGPFYTGLNRLSQSDWSWTDGNPLSYTSCSLIETKNVHLAVPGHCPSEWTYYSKTDACYKAFLDSAFDQAETVCQSTGGHLTSIHSDEENLFVSSLTHMGIEYRTEKHLTWIGLRKPGFPVNSTWAWTDGSVVDYLLWAPGKPQDITGIQNCAQKCHGAGGLGLCYKAANGVSGTMIGRASHENEDEVFVFFYECDYDYWIKNRK
ncbi:lectin C-type domain protein [Teladorsagia circumcincta]|uniref:Lectin C-type domain protein n=1 Tax=Teladorsagia circumcincta TaxID=45464 RepID=A0A2G9U366_TELCI|nr:lectin C-type domain protein [Teladorsagia circumcincta]